MTIDRVEATRRGQSKNAKGEKTHPYASIDHRVIDSPAFADMRPTAKVLLLLLARQFNGRNNGHLQATYSWCKERGIGSEHTLQAAIAELIAHGFLYRTKSHGANKVWAKYALTWLPIQEKEGLFTGGWKQLAWRDWKPSEKKATRKNCSMVPAESAVSIPDSLQKVQEVGGQKLQTMNLMPCSSAVLSSAKVLKREEKTRRPLFGSPFLIRRQVTADRGIAPRGAIQ